MGPIEIVFHLPKLQAIFPFLGREERGHLEKFFVVCAVAPFDETVSPWLPFGDQGGDDPQALHFFFEGRPSFGMGRVLHRKDHGVIRKDNEEGRHHLDGPLEDLGTGLAGRPGVDLRVLKPCR